MADARLRLPHTLRRQTKTSGLAHRDLRVVPGKAGCRASGSQERTEGARCLLRIRNTRSRHCRALLQGQAGRIGRSLCRRGEAGPIASAAAAPDALPRAPGAQAEPSALTKRTELSL